MGLPLIFQDRGQPSGEYGFIPPGPGYGKFILLNLPTVAVHFRFIIFAPAFPAGNGIITIFNRILMNNLPGTYFLMQQQDTIRRTNDSVPVQQTDSTLQDTSASLPAIQHSISDLEKLMREADDRLHKIDSAEQSRIYKAPKPRPAPLHEPVLLDSSHIIIQSKHPADQSPVRIVHDLTTIDSRYRPFSKEPENIFISGKQDSAVHPVTTAAPVPHVRPRVNLLLKENWMLPVLLSAFILITWARIVYGKMFNQTVVSFWNRKSALNLIVTRSSLYQRLSLMLLINFLLTGTLFFYLAAKHFNFIFPGMTQIQLIFSFAGILSGFFIYVFLTTIITGAVSGTRETMQEYFQYSVLFFHNTGIYLFPFVAIIPYLSPGAAHFLLWSGIFLISVFYLLRLFWLSYLFINEKFSRFYLFLYLCALEILPLLIFIRTIFR